MSYKITQFTVSLSPMTRRIIIFAPPLIIASIYACRKAYLYLKPSKSRRSINGNSIDYDIYDYALNSLATTTSLTLNDCDKDNLDGCAFSSEKKKIRSTLSNSNKCSNCRSNQKLSFRESNIYEVSFKNFSTGQLIKYGFDHLSNAIKAIEELKLKQNMLKDYSNLENVNAQEIESKIEKIFENLSLISAEFELVRNEFMPATYSNVGYDEDDDDFDDGASYLSSATTTSLGYWDPEPNLHFFEIYQDALKIVGEIKSPRTDRCIITGCDSFDDYLAKVHCLRNAFEQLLSNPDVRSRYIKIGEVILKVILEHSLRDSNECINAYYAFLDFVMNESNLDTIDTEIGHRKIAAVSFYDIVLDYMVLESFDDLENPPSAVKSVVSNRWLSASFREISLQTAVSAVMRRKRSKLVVPDGFFAHFYSILDHLSPVMAWGFLGTDENLKFKCFSIKESTHAVIRDYFSFDRCRYTSLNDLCEDILRVTEERYWELNNKLSILNV